MSRVNLYSRAQTAAELAKQINNASLSGHPIDSSRRNDARKTRRYRHVTARNVMKVTIRNSEHNRESPDLELSHGLVPKTIRLKVVHSDGSGADVTIQKRELVNALRAFD
jgi:hypothetical protein